MNWFSSNSGIPSVKLNSINFKDVNTGTVVGENGTIYKTTNSGSSWLSQTSGTTRNLLKVKHFNDSAIAVGEYGTLLTSNGSLWVSIATKTTSDIRGISGSSMNDVHVCGGGGFIRNNKNSSSGFLNFEINPMMANLVDMIYLGNVGFAVSSLNNIIIKTNNEGTNWSLPNGASVTMNWVSKPGASGNFLGDNFCVHPTNSNTVFTNFSGQTFVSRDRGETWATVGNNSGVGNRPHAFYVSSIDTNIWLCAIESTPTDKVIRTTNYGQTWTTILNINFSNYGIPLQVDQNNGQIFYFGPDGGGFYKSTDNGATFNEISGNYPFRSPCDIMVKHGSPNTIFLADGITGSGLGEIYRSTNGGVNWNKIFTNSSSSEIPSMSNTQFNPELSFCTNWPSGEIFKTVNSGDNWTLNHTNSFSGWGSDICAEDPSLIITGSWSGGNTGLSTNGGVNWNTLTGLSGSGGVMEVVERGYVIAQAGSSVYKLNIAYSYTPPDIIDIQPIEINERGTIIFPTTTVQTTGTIRNNSATNAENVTVIRKINPGGFTSLKIVSNLSANSTQLVTFDPWTFTPGITYTIKDSVYLISDLNNINDTLSATIIPLIGNNVYKLSENFSAASFPPNNWSITASGPSYWFRSTVGGFGIGAGSAKFDIWNSPMGVSQSLNSPAFNSTTSGDSIKFDLAYSPFEGATDSLIIEISTDEGKNFSPHIKLFGSTSGGATLNTTTASNSEFTPAANQWSSRSYPVPAGINSIRFRAVSGYGNNIFIDNIKVTGVSLFTIANVKFIPEGIFNRFTLNSRDSINVYLRNVTAPYAKVDSSIGILDTVTFNAGLIFSNAPSGNYYLQVIHKNAIETWSKSGGISITQGSSIDYDFTSEQTQTFGNNSVVKSGKWCAYSGDINRSGNINLTDLVGIYNDAAVFTPGVRFADLNGDRIVNLSDIVIAYNNVSGFVMVRRP